MPKIGLERISEPQARAVIGAEIQFRGRSPAKQARACKCTLLEPEVASDREERGMGLQLGIITLIRFLTQGVLWARKRQFTGHWLDFTAQ